MRVNRGLLAWGVFLLLAGAVPLAVRAGYLTDDQIRRVWSLWPLILIGIGIGILLARTRFAFLGGLLVAATFGLIVGGLLSGGIGGVGLGGCGLGGGTRPFPPREGSFAGPSASIDVELNCGVANGSSVAGTTWRVEGDDRDGTGPMIEADSGALTVRSRDSNSGPFDMVGARETWRITFPEGVLFSLKMAINAGSSTVNLGGASVDALQLDLNAGSAVIDLGSIRALGKLQIGVNAGSLDLTLPNQSFTGSIEANAGSVNLCAPSGAAVKLNTAESIVASYDYEGHGLVHNGSTWQTPGFESAAVRIELNTHANAGSFSLNPEGGCHG